MLDLIEHTEEEFEKALQEEVLAQLGIAGSPESSWPSSPKFPPGIKLFGSSTGTLQPWPERSDPRGIGIHHAGAELEPAKGDSGVKR